MAQMGMGQIRLARVSEGIKSCDDANRKFEALIGDNPQWELCYMWYRSTGEADAHVFKTANDARRDSHPTERRAYRGQRERNVCYHVYRTARPADRPS